MRPRHNDHACNSNVGHFHRSHCSTYSILAVSVAGSNDSGSHNGHDSSMGNTLALGTAEPLFAHGEDFVALGDVDEVQDLGCSSCGSRSSGPSRGAGRAARRPRRSWCPWGSGLRRPSRRRWTCPSSGSGRRPRTASGGRRPSGRSWSGRWCSGSRRPAGPPGCCGVRRLSLPAETGSTSLRASSP